MLQRTSGQLAMYIRRDEHDDDPSAGGLFIHGFRHGSKAKKQGIVLAGDELLEVNNIIVGILT
jgi:hypothetical protein